MTQQPVQRGGFERHELDGGVPFFALRTSRFKSATVRVRLVEPLDERAAARSLLAGLMRRGSRANPDLMSISRRLERLYGADRRRIEIVAPGGFYDYAAKYTKGRSRYLCPAPLPADPQAHRALEDRLAGLAIAGVIVGVWIERGFGELTEERLAVLAATLIIVGIQIFFSSFLLSILGLRRRD